MKKIKVKIIKAALSSYWYNGQIGCEFYVEEHTHEKYKLYNDVTLSSTILKSDCEVIEETAPQPEPFDLERVLNGEMFFSKDGFTRFKVVAASSFNEKLHIVETVRNGNANVEMLNMDVFSVFNHHMAPKEPEYVEAWVIVTPIGLMGLFFTLNSAQKSLSDNSWRVEKITFPKP